MIDDKAVNEFSVHAYAHVTAVLVLVEQGEMSDYEALERIQNYAKVAGFNPDAGPVSASREMMEDCERENQMDALLREIKGSTDKLLATSFS